MNVIVITAVLSCLNSGLYITSRMLHELAKSGHAPAALAATGDDKVPRLGILIGCLAGFLAALAEIVLPNEVFAYLVSTSGDIILFVYIIIAARRSACAAGWNAKAPRCRSACGSFPGSATR